MFVDGKIVGAVSEERFTRKKNDDAFPENSINWLLEQNEIRSDQLDGVAIASYEQGLAYTIQRTAHWRIDDYVREQREYWYPKLWCTSGWWYSST